MVIDTQPTWVVLRLTPSAGRPITHGGVVTCRAEQGLNRIGLTECLFPRYRERHVHKGKRCWHVRELFPRYAFLRKTEGWQRAVAAEGDYQTGVVGFAMAGAQLGEVPQASSDVTQFSINKLLAVCNKWGYVDLKPAERFALGQRVRWGSGSLADLIGKYDGLGRPGQAVVLYELLGRIVSTEVSEGDLVAA